MNDIYSQLNECLENELSKVNHICDELDKKISIAETYLSQDITSYIENFTKVVKLVRYDYQNYIYGKELISKLNAKPSKTVMWRREALYANGIPFYDYENGVCEFSYKDISSIEEYCLDRYKSAEKHVIRIGTMTNPLNGKYNIHSINQKYKKYIK